MLRERIPSGYGDGKTCPESHRTDRVTVVIQGGVVPDPEPLRQLGRPAGEEVIEVPTWLLTEVLHTCPVLHHTGQGTVLIHGLPVTDPEALRELRLPAGEQAIEVPAELLAQGLRTC